MAVVSDISILFLNVAGLLSTALVDDSNSIDSPHSESIDYKKLSCLQRSVFNNNDIIWVSETKQVTDGQLPKTLDPTKITIYSNAMVTDRGAGLALLYNPLLPTPLDLFNEYLINTILTDKIKNLLGRLGIFAFILQDAILIVSCLYGSSHRGSRGADIIREATCIVCSVTKSLTQRAHNDGNKNPVINVWGGDFNAYPKVMSNFSYSGNAKPNIPKNGLRNVFAAMDDLALGDGSLLFSNLHTKLQPSSNTHGYYTNITTRNGSVSTRTGIDHIYVSSNHFDMFSSFSHFPVNSALSSHHALRVKVDRIWRRPQLKDSPKSSNYVPAYVFRNKNFISKLKIAILECVGKHKSKINYDPALLYDHLMLQLIPSMARKFHRSFISDFDNIVKKLKQKLVSLITEGADKVTHAFHSSFLIVNENIAANYRWRLKNLGCAISDDFNSLSPLGDDDEAPNLKWLKNHDVKSKDLISKIIPGIALNAHKILTSNDKITNSAYNFFKRQYRKPNVELPVLSDFINNDHSIPSISAVDSLNLDKAFTYNEILLIISEYSKKKKTSPGFDGLPIDLFTCNALQDIIVNLFMDVLNSMMHNNGTQPSSLSTALVRLLLKDGKSRVSFDSYRPITLMSIALRIMLRVITMRLTPFLSNLIGEHQKAYVPGRRGDHGVFLLSKIIHDATYDVDSESMILQLDFKRAFDSVYHSYVKDVLSKFGVGPKLINLIILIMSSLNVQVIINDQLTKPIRVGRGLPQGSSLSAILFILCLEPLLRTGLTSGLLNGISLRGIECISITSMYYLAYADDLQLLIRNITELLAWLNFLKKFALTSGLHVNMQKSALQLVGHKFWSFTSTPLLITPSQFSQQLISDLQTTIPDLSLIINIAPIIKYCGVVLSILDLLNGDRANLMYSSWSERSKKLVSFSKYISSCPFKSSLRRARYAKSKFISLIQFLSFTSICPPIIANSIQVALNCVTFGSKKCPISLNIAVMPFSFGGYDHTNVKDRFSALSATWIAQYLSGKLPSCIDLIIKDSLQSIILKNISATMLPINNFSNLSREHFVDAALQVLHSGVTSNAIRKKTSLFLIPPLNLAISTMKSLNLSRHWSPIDGGPTINDYKQLLYEPLALNSSIIINGSLLPLSFTLLSGILNLTMVRDLVPTNNDIFCLDIASIMISDPSSVDKILELRSNCSDFKVGGSMCSSNSLYSLLPRLDISSQLCNSTWCGLIPSALTLPSISFLADKFHFNDINFDYDSYGIKSLYPLQFSVKNGETDPSNFTWILASDMSSKIITNALYINNYQCLDGLQRIRQSCHCWTKYSPGLNMDWITCFKNLSKINLPDDQFHYVDKALLHRHAPSARNVIGVMHNGVSSWLSCPRCLFEQSPEHSLVKCEGVLCFWSIFLDLIKLVIPNVYGTIQSLSTNDILSLGTFFNTDVCGPIGHHLKSFVASLFSFAIDAVTVSSLSLEFQQKLTPELCVIFTHSIYAKFIKRLNSYLVRLISCSLHKPHLMSTLTQPVDPSTDDSGCPDISIHRACVVVLCVSVPIYFEPAYTTSSYVSSSSLAAKLKSTFDPFITVGFDDLLSTRLPYLSPQNTLLWNNNPFPHRTTYVVADLCLPLIRIVTPLPLHKLAGLYNISEHLLVRVSLFTDGSCNNNGKRLAAASYSCIFPNHCHLNESLRLHPLDSHSNNRAELMAILRGCIIFVEKLGEVPDGKFSILEIYTDSLISFNYITAPSVRLPSSSVKNFDLLHKIYAIMRSIPRLVVYHVRAHTKSNDWATYWNSRADSAAKLALSNTEHISSSGVNMT